MKYKIQDIEKNSIELFKQFPNDNILKLSIEQIEIIKQLLINELDEIINKNINQIINRKEFRESLAKDILNKYGKDIMLFYSNIKYNGYPKKSYAKELLITEVLNILIKEYEI